MFNEPSEKNLVRRAALLSAVAAAVAIVSLVAVAYLMSERRASENGVVPATNSAPTAVVPAVNQPSTPLQENETNQPINAPAPTDEQYTPPQGGEVSLAPSDLQMDWLDQPSEAAGYNVYNNLFNGSGLTEKDFSGLFANDQPDAPKPGAQTLGDITTRLSEQMRLYAVGRGATNADNILYVASYNWNEGPGGPYHYMILARPQQKPIVLARYSDWFDPRMNAIFSIDSNDYIKGLELPDSIISPKGHATLVLSGKGSNSEQSNYLAEGLLLERGPAERLFASGKLVVYRADSCFFVVTPDHVAHIYDLDIASIGGNTEMHTFVPQYAIEDGTKNEAEYGVQRTGCGRAACYELFNDAVTASQLKLVGSLPNGEKFYEPVAGGTDKMAARLQSAYESYYPGYDSATNQPLPKEPFADFVTKHPILFWQDPFGEWMVWTRVDLQPQAECGKPVIYLYPVHTTEATVRVAPTGGLTVTEPAYGVGWHVAAQPNGTLTDLNNGGGQWPYLFWEGIALDYSRPNEGFIVAREDVVSFLKAALAKQGLIEKEATEFIAFWAPKMQDKPYYFVTFVPQAQFDKMAPLTVTPRPTTVIRVFMDYQGLDAPVSVRPQQLSAPARRGFTVVEWGGQLRH